MPSHAGTIDFGATIAPTSVDSGASHVARHTDVSLTEEQEELLAKAFDEPMDAINEEAESGSGEDKSKGVHKTDNAAKMDAVFGNDKGKDVIDDIFGMDSATWEAHDKARKLKEKQKGNSTEDGSRANSKTTDQKDGEDAIGKNKKNWDKSLHMHQDHLVKMTMKQGTNASNNSDPSSPSKL